MGLLSKKDKDHIRSNPAYKNVNNVPDHVKEHISKQNPLHNAVVINQKPTRSKP